jgi:predicted nuclease of predicted toxin-antitoxin system
MTILVDVNLSRLWVPFFQQQGVLAIYWTDVGAMDAPDADIMRFAAVHGHVLMTHDLDFGAMIAAGGMAGPSVLQIRTQDVLPDAIGGLVMQALAAFAGELGQGALVTITNERGRARLLPFRRKSD